MLSRSFKIEVFDPRELELASSDKAPVLQVWRFSFTDPLHTLNLSDLSDLSELSDLSQPRLARLTWCHSVSLGVTWS